MSQSDSGLGGTDLPTELNARFGRFVAAFGSVAAMSAFLLFAGFLSEFGAYRIAGLPRLSFSLTSAVEIGADVAVDILSLIVQGTRAFWLVLMVAAVILLWARHSSGGVAPWARSRPLYRFIRLGLLLLSFVVFASLVDRIQRSLTGEMHSAAAIERALQRAYADGFPDPFERQRALDREGYELRFYRLPNGAVQVEDGWRRLKSHLPFMSADRAEADAVGIRLRELPASRRDARHIFGWLALTVLALVFATVLCQWWGKALLEQARPRADIDAAIDRLVVPLTLVSLFMSILLIPLGHGVLARSTLGGEHVMVYLRGADSKSKQQIEIDSKDSSGNTVKQSREWTAIHPEPTSRAWPTGRFDCKADGAEETDKHAAQLNEALRDLTQTRQTDSDEYKTTLGAYAKQLDQFADSVVKRNCAEAVRDFWAVRPTAGLSAQAPDIAETYRRAALRVTTAYGLRIGTILTYPRDTQALTLVDRIVPRNSLQSPVWTLQTVDSAVLAESVVLPDLFNRSLQRTGDILRVEPDNDVISQLLVAPSSEALEVVMPLLRERRLFANGRGVAVTALGAMAWVSTPERPDLSRDAIILLSELTGACDNEYWPEKEERTRGTAATALHLTRSPFAAHKLAMHVQRTERSHCSGKDVAHVPTASIPQVTTAAGYLLQDLITEGRRFTPERIPSQLLQTRELLEAYLASMVTGDGIAEETRGSACTAIGLAGGITLRDEKARAGFLDRLSPEGLGRHPFSGGACVLNAPRVGIEAAELRPVLRRIARAQELPGHSAGETERLRRAAFSALADMGLSVESELVFELFLNEDPESRLHSQVTRFLDELPPKKISSFLRECAADEHRKTKERFRCLEGFEYAKDTVDGDDGTAYLIVEIARSGPVELRDAACGAIKAFRERDGRIVMRLQNQKDPTVVACLAQV